MNETLESALANMVACLVIVLVVFIPFMTLNGFMNWSREEGYEITITGTVQIHQLEYNKWFKYKYTNVELLTYSGDEYDLPLLGHIELEFGKTYRITYTRTSPLGHHQFLYGRAVDIKEIS